MQTKIMKFGGASLASLEAIQKAACQIKKSQQCRLVVVASAMGGMTDQLVELSSALCSQPPKREQDMLVTAGERISIALLSIALAELNIEAISLTGSQSGIITSNEHSNAHICDVRPIRIPPLLDEGKVVVVAGFQGVSLQKDITTLGRGGSDTTAVALGIALKACKVEFYKDVAGCYTANPKVDAEAVHLAHLNYDEALQIEKKTGESVIHPRALYLAKANAMPLHIVPFQKEDLAKNPKGSWIVENGCQAPSMPLFEDELLCKN